MFCHCTDHFADAPYIVMTDIEVTGITNLHERDFWSLREAASLTRLVAGVLCIRNVIVVIRCFKEEKETSQILMCG
jgi:hypothetical protein